MTRPKWSERLSIYDVPKGKTYGDWQEVFADSQPMQWGGFNTGRIYGALKNNAQPASFPPHRDPTERYEYAVMVFYVRHRRHGDILIDTGFDHSYHENPVSGNLSAAMRAYARLMNVQYTQKQKGIDLMSQLERHELDPAHVFLTHLHADHTGDFHRCRRAATSTTGNTKTRCWLDCCAAIISEGSPVFICWT
jgi:hypothetical protein